MYNLLDVSIFKIQTEEPDLILHDKLKTSLSEWLTPHSVFSNVSKKYYRFKKLRIKNNDINESSLYRNCLDGKFLGVGYTIRIVHKCTHFYYCILGGTFPTGLYKSVELLKSKPNFKIKVTFPSQLGIMVEKISYLNCDDCKDNMYKIKSQHVSNNIFCNTCGKFYKNMYVPSDICVINFKVERLSFGQFIIDLDLNLASLRTKVCEQCYSRIKRCNKCIHSICSVHSNCEHKTVKSLVKVSNKKYKTTKRDKILQDLLNLHNESFNNKN